MDRAATPEPPEPSHAVPSETSDSEPRHTVPPEPPVPKAPAAAPEPSDAVPSGQETPGAELHFAVSPPTPSSEALSAAPEPRHAAPPGPPGSGTGAAAAAPKPRTPAAVLVAVVLLWLFAAAAALVTVVSTVATAFEVSVRYAGAWSPLEFVEPALIAAVAAACAMLAVKVRSGRDWARRTVVIVSALVLAAAVMTGAALNAGTGAVAALLFALLLVLLLLRPARDWCDCDAPRHSPKAAGAAQPPNQVLVSLLVLWTATGTALHLGASGLLDRAGEDVRLAADSAAWTAGAVMLLALVHAALNIGFSFHRGWARWTTLALTAAYTAWLIAAAVRDLLGSPGPWAALALLGLITLALTWSLAGADSRQWCRRATTGNPYET
jgi:hypothetical protein